MKRSSGLFSLLLLAATSVMRWLLSCLCIGNLSCRCAPTYAIVVENIFLFGAAFCCVLSVVFWKTQSLISKILSILILIFLISAVYSNFSSKNNGIFEKIFNDKFVSASPNLTKNDDGQMLLISEGKQFNITLSNPGDGGYVFDEPIYDSSVLTLVSKNHKSPTSGAMGDFGTDTWVFEGKAMGNSDLEIDIYRPSENKPHQKDFKINVNVELNLDK